MPSPFPGMDPFIEGQAWETFHHGVITSLLEIITARVRPRYVVRVEERVYVEHRPEQATSFIRPDVAVPERSTETRSPEGAGGTATLVALAPFVLTVPMPEREREVFLAIRERESMEVVTVIEVLSPGNKRSGSDGRREYLNKREAVFLSAAHLIELDLLRAGERLPTIEPLPPADYYAFVSREWRRPRVEVYWWSLRQRLPVIPVPLAGDDPDVPLDLQAAFNTVYDRAGYDYSLDYRRPVEPPFSEADAAWAQPFLAAGLTPPQIEQAP